MMILNVLFATFMGSMTPLVKKIIYKVFVVSGVMGSEFLDNVISYKLIGTKVSRLDLVTALYNTWCSPHA